MITLELPWPPSLNHYYKHVGNKVLISKEGRQYREVVVNRIKVAGIKMLDGHSKLGVMIQLYPPDRRRRDVDNSLKCLLDAFTAGGIYEDDSQIYFLSIEKLEPMPPDGMAVVKVGFLTEMKYLFSLKKCRDNYEQKKELPKKERNCTIDSNVNAL
jgi:Holliday junction resolvase RusA-like endonuclease